jgi:hypothetical protein
MSIIVVIAARTVTLRQLGELFTMSGLPIFGRDGVPKPVNVFGGLVARLEIHRGTPVSLDVGLPVQAVKPPTSVVCT